ncbi:hypothetical protein CcrColossus_gp294 [Caulobacter phage CcrColossus]|uniref:Uncharacterized protein n=1 Tax=Caulobacter phage CcrColossus TaxID=1211640 RepID=K4JS40_9CAUD|nr:hypothetical protein CcrColossus_gp294 [Caulobacter phage CcrColossus]AFU88164.1 hypothetical protein CcrColossus_gp294 [Caulobacter phage CcrColossus]
MTIPTIGESHFSDEKAMDYPDLIFKVQKGAVRTYWHDLSVLKFDQFTSRVQPILVKRLIAQFDEALTATEKASGLRRPSRDVGHCIFDDEIVPVEITLCEVEQQALRRLTHIVRRRNEEDWQAVYHVLSDHIVLNGGHDHSQSLENSTWLHAESKKVQDYLAKHRHPVLKVKPYEDKEFEVLPFEPSGWQKFVAAVKRWLGPGPDCTA